MNTLLDVCRSRTAFFVVVYVLLMPIGIAQNSPNVVVIVADDAGFADWGFMDGVSGSNPTPTNIPTPSLDALAARGVKFSRAYVGQSCQPTRASLVTGGYQQRIGNELVGNNYYLPTQGFAPQGVPEGVPGETVTIWERMRSQGYTTGAIGKWHLGQTDAYTDAMGNAVPSNRPQAQGIDDFFGIWHGSRSYFGGLNPNNPDYETQALRQASATSDTIVEADYNGQYMTDVFGDYAVDFIERNHSAGAPFFLYQSFTAPHTPLQATASDLAFIDSLGVPEFTGTRRTYAAMQYALDRNVGKMLAALEDPNGDGDTSDSIANNTLVLFVNDNGGADAQSSSPNGADNGVLRRGKGSSWEGGIRVPMIISGAGVSEAVEGTTYDKPVHGVDILPTAFAAGGGSFGPADTRIDGVNLLPFINGTDSSSPHDVIVNRHRNQFAVIKGDWKLTWSGNSPAVNPQLYNLAADISETNNVAGANPALVDELKRDLTDHEVTFDKPRYEILGRTDEDTINIFDHFTFTPDVGSSSEETTVIGGAVGDGDFQHPGTGSGPLTYNSHPNWFNAQGTGSDEDFNFSNTSQMGGSTQSNSRGGMPFNNRTQVNNTGHTVMAAGEQFSIRYDFGAGGAQASWNGNETMRMFLFTANTAVDGEITLANMTELGADEYVVDRANDGQWTIRDVDAFYTSTAADVGKKVYLGMVFQDGGGDTLFPRIDVIELTVAGTGSPSTVVTNWSKANAWFEGGTTNEASMLDYDAFAGAVLEFETSDSFSYISNNDMVRQTGLEFMLNKMLLSGTFAGQQNQSAVIQGNDLLFTNDLEGAAPQLVVDATNAGGMTYSFDIDLDMVMYNDLIISGDGDAMVTINGNLRDYHESRSLTKSGLSEVTLNGENSYTGDTNVESGKLKITNAYLEDTSDVRLASGAILTLSFSGTDTIDALFIDGTPQLTGTWGAVGSGADHESPMLEGTGMLLVTTIDVLQGDYNGDGIVNLADYTVWRNNLGAPAGTLQNDITGEPVGATQYNVWKTNFGATSGPEAAHSSAAVPEPSAAVLLLTPIALRVLSCL